MEWKRRGHKGRTVNEGLHGRVTTDTIQAAHALVGGVTGIDFGELDGGAGRFKRLAGGLPSRLHVLAVTTPAESVTILRAQLDECNFKHNHQGA